MKSGTNRNQNIRQKTIVKETRELNKPLEQSLIEQTEKSAAELIIANKELAIQNREKEKRADELNIANKELAYQNAEKEKRAAELITANKELAIQNKEKEKRAAELIIANKELANQNREKEKRAAELIIANKELVVQNREKEKREDELIIANKELAYQNEEKEKRAAELIKANKELAVQNEEKEKKAAKLIIANKELAIQNREKEKRADELIIASKVLDYQNTEKEKRAAELIIANKELAYQNAEKEKRAAELIIANKELAIQNKEKEKKAEKLIIANKELAFQNVEKENRAAELIIANKELAFQNEEKEKRAAELIIANKELAYQNAEKEKRAAELIVANKELAIQNKEKEKKAEKLIIANKELAFQNEEKEKRAAELIIANKELAFQNEEKEKRAAELIIANQELAFQNEEKAKRAVELIISESRYRSYVEATGQIAWVTNADGEIEEDVPSLRKFTGQSYDEAKGSGWAKALHPDDVEHTMQIWNKAVATKNPYETEFRMYRYDGVYRHLLARGFPVFREDGSIIEWVGSCIDITERNHSEIILKESEEKFRMLIEKNPLPLCYLNNSGVITFRNDRFISVFGYDEIEVPSIAEWWLKAYPNEEYRKWVVQNWDSAVKHAAETGNDIKSDEYHVTCKDSTVREIIISGIIIKDDLLVTFIDITERKKDENKIIIANKELAIQNKEKEKRAAELIIANKELAFQNEEKEKKAAKLIIANKELAFQNEEKEKRAAELVTANKELAFQNEEKEKRAAELVTANKELAFQNAEKEKRAAELIIANKELAFQNAEKEKRAAELVTANKELAFQNTEKEKRAAELIVTNKELHNQILERKQAESALRETNEYLENLFGYANAPIMVWDVQFNITRFNPAFEVLTGRKANDVIGKSIKMLFPAESADSSMELILKAQKGERMNIVEIKILHKDGSEKTLLWNSASVLGADGKTHIATIAQGHDITVRNQIEEQLKSTMQNLERSNQELEQFAYVASHDLQEPLRMVSSYTQLLERKYKDKLDQDANEFIQYAVDGASRMQKLINDLLDYSRVTSRGKEFTNVDISGVLGQVISNLQLLIIENTALITNDDLPEVKADESQILRVFQNIIQNALKFKSKTELPKIHISCKKKDNFYEFAIRDNGIGMDMQYHDRVFIIFQRLHTKEEYPGTGIGLSICKRIIERHGGKIWFESKVNEGTTFHFTLNSLLK